MSTLLPLRWIADTLVVIYAILVASSVLPPNILDPLWQSNLIGSLVGFAIYPLIGLAIIHFIGQLAGADSQIAKQKVSWSRLAVLVSFCFVLLVPLQLSALFSQVNLAHNQRQTAIARSQRLMLEISKSVDQAKTSGEIFAAIQAFKLPLPPASYQNLALPELKQKIKQDFRLAAQTVKALPSNPGPRAQASFISYAGSALRSILLSLAYGFGFAALAQRKGKSAPLLMEAGTAWNRSIRGLTKKPSRSSNHERALADYLKSLYRNEGK